MFRTPEEELKELVKELCELKDVLREISNKVKQISSKVTQIESRSKRAFPSEFPKPTTESNPVPRKKTDPPTISPKEALELYDSLVDTAKKGEKGKVEVRDRLEKIDLPNLLLLSKELGVSLGKNNPSRKTLTNGILGRLNESIMLSVSSFRQRSESLKEKASVEESAPKQVNEADLTQNSEPSITSNQHETEEISSPTLESRPH